MEENNITSELDETQTKQRITEIKRTMQIMEWDIKRNQINAAMRQKYEDLKKEYDSLSSNVAIE